MAKATRIQTLLCKKLKVSNPDAFRLIYEGKVYINGKPAKVNQLVLETDVVNMDDVIIKEPKVLKFYMYYKPRGVECTLNKDIPEALVNYINIPKGFSYVGRLDKESEGLLIITNDGKWSKMVTCKGNSIEKEYFVIVNKPVTPSFVSAMQQGVLILGKMTEPCRLRIEDDVSFFITLTQGMNRQIRRMCYKLGYDVMALKRTRFGNFQLNNLKPGELMEL